MFEFFMADFSFSSILNFFPSRAIFAFGHRVLFDFCFQHCNSAQMKNQHKQPECEYIWLRVQGRMPGGMFALQPELMS